MTGLSEIVKTVCRYAAGPLMVFGAYVFTRAEHSHGVGFAGGLVIALAVVMLILAFGRRIVLTTLPPARALTLAAVFLLLMTALSATLMYAGTSWVPALTVAAAYPILVLLLNIALCLTTACAFIYLFLELMRGK